MHKYDLNLREYWRIIKRRKLIILFTVVVMGVFSFISAILGKPVPIYKTSSTVQILKNASLVGAYANVQLTGASNAMETQTYVIKSYYMLELTAKKMGLIPADLSPEEVRQNNKYVNTITDLQERVQTEQRGNSDLVDITVTANEPKFVTNLCNTLTESYKTQHTLDLNRKTIEGKKFIEGQFVISKDKLAKSEEASKQFREINKWTSLENETTYLMSQINRLQGLYDQDYLINQKITAAAQLLIAAENTPLASNKSFYFDEAAPPYKALNDRLVNLMMERDTLLLTYTDDFPQVKAIKAQIHDVVESMKSHLKAQQNNLTSNLRIYRRQLTELNNKFKILPEKNLELTRLSRDVDIGKEVYAMLEKKYQEALIGEAEKLEEVKIVKPAIEPLSPINPPKTGTNTILGTVLGLILGVVFAFLIETFDTSIGAIEEVEDFLGVHVMGIIPFVSLEEIKTFLKDDPNVVLNDDKIRRYARLTAHFVPSSTLSESYKALRTSLSFLCSENNLKTILFTSSSPGEGKTSVVVNLAITMAQIGQKVLLIDGDLRRPVVSRLFGIDQIPGLTDVVLGNYEWHKVVRSVADFITGKMSVEDIMKTPGMDNLNIITSGTYSPNPVEILNSKAIGEFMNQIRKEYDIILIDAPPVLAATDAVLWSSRVDGSVLVYQVGKIARGALKRSKISLENLKANVLGVVLNGLRAEISPDFGQDYYYYYYHNKEKTGTTLLDRILGRTMKPFQHGWFSIVDFFRRKFRKKTRSKAEPADDEEEGKFLVKGERPPDIAKEDVASIAVLTDNASTGITPSEENQKRKKPTPPWMKLLIIAFVVLLLAAGVFYETYEIQKQKMGNGSMRQQTIIRESAPVVPANSEPVTLKDALAGASNGEQKSASVTARDGNAPSTPAEPVHAPETAPLIKPQSGSELQVTVNLPGKDKPFSIQVKSVPTSGEARRIVEELKRKREDAFSTHVTIKGRGEWNRILIGHFASTKDAAEFMKNNNIEAKYPGSIVQKIIEK